MSIYVKTGSSSAAELCDASKKLPTRVPRSNDFLASALTVAEDNIALFSGGGENYVGELPEGTYAYGLCFIYVRYHGSNVSSIQVIVYPEDVDEPAIRNVYYNSSWQGWRTLEGGFITIPNNANLNNYITPGNYCCSTSAGAATISNKPTAAGFNAAFTMKVEYATGYSYPAQTIQVYNTGDMAYRMYYPSDKTWSAWRYNRFYTE